MKDVVIVGAGAMGCLFAARLLDGGARVTLIDANIERLKNIEEHGLELIDDSGSRRVQPRTSLAQSFSGPVDIVMLFTKSVHSVAAVGSISHLASLKPVALTLQNGLGNAEILARAFDADRVLLGSAHVPADLQSPNQVISHGFATLHIGGYVRAAQPLASTVAELLKSSGFDAIVAHDIVAAVWEKLAFNAALNATAMVTQATNGEMNNAYGRRIANAAIMESVEVAKALGLKLYPSVICEMIDKALSEHPTHKASMLQDRENGRLGEIESINGAIVRIGQEHGIPAPVNATLADLVRIIETRTCG